MHQQNGHQGEAQEGERSQGNETQCNDSQRGGGGGGEQQEQEGAQPQPQPLPRATHTPNIPSEKELLPEECSICLYRYKEEERRPRTLPCGHTLCSLCIAALLKEAHITCPTCLTHHHAISVSHFPVNYALESMIIRYRILQARGASVATADITTTTTTADKTKQDGGAAGGVGLGRKLQSVIKEQRSTMESTAATLKEELSQLEHYRAQLSLSLAKHGQLLEELNKVGQQHRDAMKVLMEEDVRVDAFMEEGEKDQRYLRAAQDQLDSITTAQKAYPIIDTADNTVLLVEEWIQNSKEKFPNGAAYTVSCRVLENTEAVLKELVLDSEDANESIRSGHLVFTIPQVLKNIHERSAKVVKQHLQNKLRNAMEDKGVTLNKDEENKTSFPNLFSERDSAADPAFTFKFDPSPFASAKFEFSQLSSMYPDSHAQPTMNRLRKQRLTPKKDGSTTPFFAFTTTTTTTTTATTTTATTTTTTTTTTNDTNDKCTSS